MKNFLLLLLATASVLTAAGFNYADDFPGRGAAPFAQMEHAWGNRFKAMPAAPPGLSRGRGPNVDAVRRWNEIAINASGLDHTPVGPGETRVFGEQLGPGRSSRALAIVHIAMFDALNAVTGKYRGYTGVEAPRGAVSMEVAVAMAAHDTLAALFPSQTPAFDALVLEDIDACRNRIARDNGIVLGRRAAEAILALRVSDGAAHAEPVLGVDYLTSDAPGRWRQDPVSLVPVALGAKWSEVKPFALSSSSQFRIPPPPALSSARHTAAYNEVKALGGDGITTPTVRTPEQTFIGIFWAYDGTPSLCAPPRLYNQVALAVADRMRTRDIELARLLALLNLAMADTGFAAWESKYFYDVWRPITGIRESDPGTGPSGLGDGNPATVGDAAFTPLGAPASNLNGPNFTPPFPAYPSGHAAFGGALFQTLRRFYGTDRIAFTFVSDEYNGVTRDNQGNVRPYIPRHFKSLSQAEEENGQSRIYLGIHWEYDKTEGILQGRNVADYVFDSVFTPRRGRR
jgi:hypothetical protein